MIFDVVDFPINVFIISEITMKKVTGYVDEFRRATII